MGDRVASIRWIVLVLAAACCTLAQAAPTDAKTPGETLELARHLTESSSVRIEPAKFDNRFGIALIFEGTEDLHYYAKPETAPAPGLELGVKAQSEAFDFESAVFPKWHPFTDALGNTIEVFSGNFTIFLPMTPGKTPPPGADVEITLSGIACTSLACLSPFRHELNTTIDWSQNESWKQIALESDAGEHVPAPTKQGYSIWFALPLAFLAGLMLNIMPCVWPVLPLIVMRIVEQAKQAKGKSTTMGLAFCLGILLFFACLAGANIILQVFYETALQWGDQFRNPLFLAGMALLLVVLSLSMFGVFTISVPSALTGGSKGHSGPIGMGFLAAILSTPCGFSIMAAAFGWAQTQHWLLATVAIMFIGLGMATPYMILTSIPALLKNLPKPGKWMELFKQGVGFILLAIAVKLIAALPETRKASVLFYAVTLAFCVWMWGAWVSLNTKPFRRRLIRIIAVVLAVATGWMFLAPQQDLIEWQPYDSAVIDQALAQDRPVLMKFTADWCFSCQAADKFVYSGKNIAELIKLHNVLAVKADTTKKSYPATVALKNIYAEPGVPVSMMFLPGEKDPIRWHGFLFGDQLAQAMESIADKEDTGEPENK